MARTFIAQGSSRNVFSSDEFPEDVIKRPIPERYEAGHAQNTTEAENYEIAQKMGLSCFAKMTWKTDDNSEIRVEKCKGACYGDFEDRYRDAFARNGVHGNEDILKFFAWKTVYAFNRLLDAAERRGIPASVEDITRFFESESDIILSGGTSTLNLIIDMFVNKNENLRLFREILSFSLENRNRLLVDDLWQAGQYGITKDGRMVVIDYGYSVDLSRSSLYGVSKKKTGLFPEMVEFTKSFKVGNFLFMVDSENRTQMKDSDGIWWTRPTRTVYMNPSDVTNAIQAVRRKVDFTRVFRVESDWETSLTFQELTDEKRVPLIENVQFSKVPAEGLVPLELYLIEDNIVRNFYSTVFVKGMEKETIGELKNEL